MVRWAQGTGVHYAGGTAFAPAGVESIAGTGMNNTENRVEDRGKPWR